MLQFLFASLFLVAFAGGGDAHTRILKTADGLPLWMMTSSQFLHANRLHMRLPAEFDSHGKVIRPATTFYLPKKNEGRVEANAK